VEWDFYWKRHPDGPFATLIRVATTYLRRLWRDLFGGEPVPGPGQG
jgi:hypothetical protein